MPTIDSPNLTPEEVSKLHDEYLALLDCDKAEQVYQSFIEKNTSLIPREFVQNHGIGCKIVLRKVPLGSDYKTDFFYFSKSSDDWNAVFIEIEKPSKKFFQKNGKFTTEFNQALQQIGEWRAWLSNTANLNSFLSGTVSEIQVPKHMQSNPTHPKFVLVYGRRDEYSGNSVLRGKIRAQERDDFKIMTFDSLAESLDTKGKLYMCAKKNSHIEILGDEFLGASIFSWVEPSILSVSAELHKKMNDPGLRPVGAKHLTANDDGEMVEAVARAAELVQVRGR